MAGIWADLRPYSSASHFAPARQLIPGRMIVLGAGRGHDAREFSRNGFQVTTVDFASHAVQEIGESRRTGCTRGNLAE